mmetsp:Transcript_45766/g.145886  ORF Transcript_45766/g.145886 Transcript_45766/m.145886 type:complete len:203 (+) Transcript_45766:187-795(+)
MVHGCEKGTVLFTSKVVSTTSGRSRHATHSSAMSSLDTFPLRTSPCWNSSSIPRGSSVSAAGRTTAKGMPLLRTASSPASLYVRIPPRASFIPTAGGSIATSIPGRFQRVLPAEPSCTKRAPPSGCMYAVMDSMGISNGPGVKEGLRSPSYSNLEHMIWMERMEEGSRAGESGDFLARNMGKKSAKGMRIVSHSPEVSTERQ